MRPYRSPIHIIPEERLTQSEAVNLRMLRREVLLRLELAGGTTLEVNGHTYDRNDLLAAIDTLQQDLELHLRLYRNRPLLAFVEKGDPALFRQPAAWTDLEDPEFTYWLKPHFTLQYGNLLYQCVATRGFQSIDQLRQIRESGFVLPAIYRDESHRRAFTYLQGLIREARRLYPAPFSREKRKKVIDPAVEAYINPHHYGVFQQLDEDFYPVIQEFGRYGHRLLAMAFPTKTRLRTLSRPTLHTLHEAARITMLTNDDPSIADINRNLRSYLYSGHATIEEPGWPQWLKIGGFIAYLIFLFAMNFDGCDQSPPPYTLNLDQLITDINYSSLPLTDDFLIGHWQAHFWREEEHFIRHDWIFRPQGQGQSTYSMVLPGLDEPCRFSYDFQWELTYETLEGQRYSRLHMTAPRVGLETSCLTAKVPQPARSTYDELMQKMRPGTLIDSCYLATGLYVNLGNIRSFKVIDSGQIYREISDSTAVEQMGTGKPADQFNDIPPIDGNE